VHKNPVLVVQIAQFKALQFTRGCTRQRWQKSDDARVFVRCQVLLDVVLQSLDKVSRSLRAAC